MLNKGKYNAGQSRHLKKKTLQIYFSWLSCQPGIWVVFLRRENNNQTAIVPSVNLEVNITMPTAHLT